MKLFKLKGMLIAWGLGFLVLFGLLVFVALFISDEEDFSGEDTPLEGLDNVSVSSKVLKHQPTVEKYAEKYGVSDYIPTLLAIMEVESAGELEDVMQSSESLGLPVNTLGTEDSIKQGTKYFSELLQSAEKHGVDENTTIQAYNYGGGFIDYVNQKEKLTALNWQKVLRKIVQVEVKQITLIQLP